jgi:hypothetical protein
VCVKCEIFLSETFFPLVTCCKPDIIHVAVKAVAAVMIISPSCAIRVNELDEEEEEEESILICLLALS